MALSPTATRMMQTLPVYYWDNPLIQRILQARANEIDRVDAGIDSLKDGMVPTQATDDYKQLSMWEFILGLSIAPPTATLADRQGAVKSALARLDAVTATAVKAILDAQIGSAYTLQRDTPAVLQDTITIHFAEGSFLGQLVQRFAQQAWPAHRALIIAYDEGFVLDYAELDVNAL